MLDSLIEEDDSVPNVWYMLAMCLLGGSQTAAAEEALQHGKKLLTNKKDTEELAKDFSDLKVGYITAQTVWGLQTFIGSFHCHLNLIGL